MKLEVRCKKVEKMLDRIMELADCDLVVSDAVTRVNDYSMNIKFAKKLQDVAKGLETTAQTLLNRSKDVLGKCNIA